MADEQRRDLRARPARRMRPAARGAVRAAQGRGSSLLRDAVGVLGELLITAGVLVGLFLVWQFWWTDVTAAGQHGGTVTALEERWSPGADPGAPAPSGAGTIAPPQSGEPPTVPRAPENTPWAVLHVPAFDQSVIPVGEGVSLEGVLNVIGAGRYPESAMPGEVGNFALAGHRTTYGRPFHDIARLRPGDPIVLETADAYFVYTVTSHEIITPDQVDVIAPVPGSPGREPDRRLLTLTACHPMFSARERYVVHAELSSWTVRADGIPAELAGSEES